MLVIIITEPGKNDHDAVCASLGYATRDEMACILRHRAKEVKVVTSSLFLKESSRHLVMDDDHHPPISASKFKFI